MRLSNWTQIAHLENVLLWWLTKTTSPGETLFSLPFHWIPFHFLLVCFAEKVRSDIRLVYYL